MSRPVPVVIQGLGPIGARILVAAHADARVEVVGAVDVDPAKVGRSAADVAGGGPPQLRVVAELAELAELAEAARDGAVVLQATGSYLAETAAHVEAALARGMHVVSTCEELSWPFERHPELSRRLDARARAAARTVVGTGVNPGFLMDQLPVTLAAASHSITSVEVRRFQDPRLRRASFLRKVGTGLSREAYDRLAASGAFGHVGLRESGQLIAAGLGWRVEAWAEELLPVQAGVGGAVLGTRQTLAGRTADGRTLRLEFEASTAVEEPRDEIDVAGTPPLRLRFLGGVSGDDATAAAVLRAARVVPSAPRGLVTVLDLPLRRFAP